MAGAKARHLQRVGDSRRSLPPAVEFQDRCSNAPPSRHRARVRRLIFAVKLLFVDGRRLRFSRKG